jgi:hypothetical protein
MGRMGRFSGIFEILIFRAKPHFEMPTNANKIGFFKVAKNRVKW